MLARVSFVACLLAVVVAVPVIVEAQEALLSGTITDDSGGVLPGVTVTAVHEESGNQFVAVTDERGQFRLALRIGRYQVVAALPDFATVTRSLELLVGQRAVANMELQLGGLAEAVTVTGEAPLIATSQSSLGGNIDSRQMQEIPLAGRNWLDLALLAPGAVGNATAGAPVTGALDNTRGMYQMNIDGQAANQNISFAAYNGQMSRDALAEFEVLTNRFDATQGRSAFIQVNAVTRSGTNQFAGTLSGYVRDDNFIATNPVAQRVLPYSNQQFIGTFGGPIVRDRAHFFGYYEREREPQTVVFNSPYPTFNLDLPPFARADFKTGGRGDAQFTTSRRLMVRGGRRRNYQPYVGGGATAHPSAMYEDRNHNDEAWSSFTQVLGSRGTWEVAGGVMDARRIVAYVHQRGKDACQGMPPATPLGVINPCIPPRIVLRGYAAGVAPGQWPQDVHQRNYEVKSSLSLVASGYGNHIVKVGGGYIRANIDLDFEQQRFGLIDATGGPAPANLESLFPVWDDHLTWNLAALSPITVSYSQSIGFGEIVQPRDIFAFWFQDDLEFRNGLTLNLGLRYDVSLGGIGDRVAPFPPIRLEEDIKADLNNIAPRLGFAYSLPERKTVVRGGWGRFFGEVYNNPIHFSQLSNTLLVAQVFNDGRPDFVSDPYDGNPPTREELQAQVRNFPFAHFDPTQVEAPYANTTSIGLQRQFGETMSVQADYVYRAHRQDPYTENANLTYDSATGVNYSFRDESRRRYPQFGTLTVFRTGGKLNYHGLETAITKRFSNRWQASATYTLSGMTEWRPCWGAQPTCPSDLGGVWERSAGEQRHRMVYNGIWELPYDFQLSGLYFYGSGERLSTSAGAGDVRQQGTAFSGRVRLDGTIMPANDFVGEPIHRVDMRVQRRFRFGGVRLDAMLELFNVFNRANFGGYNTNEASAAYGRPTYNANVAYTPRMAQFAFRATF
jgi:hypothetical protein